jgi:hypothetical protein
MSRLPVVWSDLFEAGRQVEKKEGIEFCLMETEDGEIIWTIPKAWE